MALQCFPELSAMFTTTGRKRYISQQAEYIVTNVSRCLIFFFAVRLLVVCVPACYLSVCLFSRPHLPWWNHGLSAWTLVGTPRHNREDAGRGTDPWIWSGKQHKSVIVAWMFRPSTPLTSNTGSRTYIRGIILQIAGLFKLLVRA
jgi:hypothetical protein